MKNEREYPDFFDELDIRRQYIIGFDPPALERDGKYRRVTVRLPNEEVQSPLEARLLQVGIELIPRPFFWTCEATSRNGQTATFRKTFCGARAFPGPEALVVAEVDPEILKRPDDALLYDSRKSRLFGVSAPGIPKRTNIRMQPRTRLGGSIPKTSESTGSVFMTRQIVGN